MIVHLKSLKRQIFKYGGSNILGLSRNKSDFFQVWEQILLFYYFGSITTHGHIASKRKRLATLALHLHTPGNREYSTARPARHIAREGVLPRIFTFMWDRSWANRVLANRTLPTAGLETETRGRSSCSREAKKFGVWWGSLIECYLFITSKMPMRCTENQDAFVWVVYVVGEKDEQEKALFANVERGVGIFLQNCHSFIPIRQI